MASANVFKFLKALFLLLVPLVYFLLPHGKNVNSNQRAILSHQDCKHFYFELGTNNGKGLEHFITRNSQNSDGQVRPVLRYREEHNLKMEDFCVFGFEPNPEHTQAHRDVEQEMSPFVRHIKIFSGTVAGVEAGFTKLLVDKSGRGENAGFPAWGSSVMSNHKIRNREVEKTESVSTASINFPKMVERMMTTRKPGSHVIVRLDIEGSTC